MRPASGPEAGGVKYSPGFRRDATVCLSTSQQGHNDHANPTDSVFKHQIAFQMDLYLSSVVLNKHSDKQRRHY